jgi:hypothetical protein
VSAYHRVHWCKVTIASVEYDVWLVDQTKEPAMTAHSGSACDCSTPGYYDERTQSILIDWELSPPAAETTLWHELGHAILSTYGISLSGDDEPHTSEREEKIGNALWAAEFDVLKRNGFLRFPPRPSTPGDRGHLLRPLAKTKGRR